jgi:hypothetical protein
VKFFNFMKKKNLSRDEQAKIIALRVKQSKQLYNHWLNISRAFQRGETIELIVDERA